MIDIEIRSLCSAYVLAARVGRKRGKMNLEKTINKNMFNMSSAIHNANPLVPSKPSKTDSPSSTPLSSILNNPKQKLTTQFKRAITAIKNRTDSPQIVHTEKILDSPILPTFHDEATKAKDNLDDYHSSTIIDQTKTTQIYIQTKTSSTQFSETKSPSTTTIVAIDLPQQQPQLVQTTSRPTTANPNSPSARLVKQSLQQIHSSILQTMQQPHSLSPLTTSSSATLSPTSTSSTATGEVAILETIL